MFFCLFIKVYPKEIYFQLLQSQVKVLYQPPWEQETLQTFSVFSSIYLLRLPTLFNFEQVAATRLRLCSVKNRDPIQWSVVVIIKVSNFFSGFLLSTQANFSSVRDSWMHGILSQLFGWFCIENLSWCSVLLDACQLVDDRKVRKVSCRDQQLRKNLRKTGKREVYQNTCGERKVLFFRKRRERWGKLEDGCWSSGWSSWSRLTALSPRWSRWLQHLPSFRRSSQSSRESSNEKLSTSKLMSWLPILG